MRDKTLTSSRATRYTSHALKCMSLHKERLTAAWEADYARNSKFV